MASSRLEANFEAATFSLHPTALLSPTFLSPQQFGLHSAMHLMAAFTAAALVVLQ